MPDFALKNARICVIGLGLMGGSLAMALKNQVAGISAVDVNPKSRDQAVAWGIVGKASDDLKVAGEANLVVLATPVRTLIGQIRELAGILTPGAVVIDLGSVKAPVVEAMNTLPETIGAVAGHPMCGKEVSGLEHADSALFHMARFVLCRTERTTPEAWKIARELVEAVGAQVMEMDAVQHDRVAAGTSHLPYLLSAALTLTTGMHAAHDEAGNGEEPPGRSGYSSWPGRPLLLRPSSTRYRPRAQVGQNNSQGGSRRPGARDWHGACSTHRRRSLSGWEQRWWRWPWPGG